MVSQTSRPEGSALRQHSGRALERRHVAIGTANSTENIVPGPGRQKQRMQTMSRIRFGAIGRASMVVVAAALAWGTWCAGIAWFNGWEGLNWLRGFQWGAFPVCVVIAAASAVAVTRDHDAVRRSIFILLASGLCLGAFAAARSELYAMYSCGLEPAGAGPYIRLALYSIAVVAGITWLARWLLTPLAWWTALCLAGALLLALPLALATVAVFPGDRHPDFFNAIRLGYPVLWTALLVPFALWCGVKV